MDHRNISSTDAPAPKRVKIGLACRRCRDRKTRCDGGRPACAACERRHVADTCVYERAPPSSQQYIAGLENRLERLERGSQAVEDERPSQAFTGVTGRRTYGQALSDGDEITMEASNASRSETLTSPSAQPRRQVDGLATVGVENGNNTVYGESSTIAFVRHVAQENRVNGASHRLMAWSVTTYFEHHSYNLWCVYDIEVSPLTFDEHFRRAGEGETIADPSSPDGHQEPSSGLAPLDSLVAQGDEQAVLPLRRNADDYLNRFWEFVHPLFPILYKDSFIENYEDLWKPHDHRGADRDSLTFMPMLNLVFALGCQFSDLVPAEQKVSAGKSFYKRSRTVLLYDILGSTSVSVVQWLLLSGVYLQSTSFANHCWNSVGLAVRLAQNLGMHLENGDRRSESQLDREMGRRVWHTCVVLDRLLAMTFGRPLMIHTSYTTPVPLLIDDKYLSSKDEGIQPTRLHSKMGLFVYSCGLFEILADILTSFYTPRRSSDAQSNASIQRTVLKVMDFSNRLDAFSASVPDYLKPTHSVDRPQRTGSSTLQQQVLHCRFLYTRMLSLRPLLLLATKQGTEDVLHVLEDSNVASLDNHVAQRCCFLCVETAHRLIETIHMHLDTLYKSSGWHSVYFTFASATILLAAMRSPSVSSQYEGAFQQSWNRCFAILKHYEQQIHSAPYAAQVLEKLRQQVQPSQLYDATQHTSDPLRSFFGTPMAGQSWMSQAPTDSGHYFDFSQFNPHGTESISDAWFSQHIVGLDGLF